MILIATDFSHTALHAARLGLHIAMTSDSKVMLLNTYKVPTRAGMFMSMDMVIRKTAEEDMMAFVGEIEEAYLPFIAETRVIQGYPEEVIKRLDDQLPIGLVVLGTQGESALREIFMGTTATSLFHHLSCPMLAVPAEAAIASPESFVFAWDGKALSTEDVDTLIHWAFQLKCRLCILHVHRVEDLPPDSETVALLGQRQILLDEIPGEGDAKDEIDDYLAAKPNTWLALIKRKRGFFEPLFHDSMVKRQIFTTTSPLLLI